MKEDSLRSRLHDVVGPVEPSDRGVRSVEANLEIDAKKIELSKIGSLREFSYNSGPGPRVHGSILKPAFQNSNARELVAMCFHQTTEPATIGRNEVFGCGGDKNLAYGITVASEGVPVIALDHPGFGEYTPDVYVLGFESVVAQTIWNHMALIPLFSQLGIARRASILAVGHSLGGTNAMLLSMYCDQVAGMVCSGAATTFARFAERHGGTVSRWSRPEKYFPLIRSKFGDDHRRIPFDFPELLAEFAPKPLAIVSTTEDEIFPVQGAVECGEYVSEKYSKLNHSDNFHHMIIPGRHRFEPVAQTESCAFVLSRI